MALLNAMMHAIVEEGPVDAGLIAERTLGYEKQEKKLAGYGPDEMAPICGISAQPIRDAARLYASSKGSMILWGMAISEHVHSTDNAHCLIALAPYDEADRAAGYRPRVPAGMRPTGSHF